MLLRYSDLEMDTQKLVIILLLCIYNVFASCTRIQNRTSDASDIFLTDQIADFDYARVMLYKTVDCCAKNFSKILWYFQSLGDSVWYPYPWKQTINYELQNRNQTLEILRIGLDDEGVYKCVAFSAQNTIIAQHNTTLDVYSCTDRVKPEAYGPKDKYSDIGKRVTFTCTGDFGCNSDSARDVSWYDENWDLLTNKTAFPRYEIITVERANHTIVESNFTIILTSEDDFHKTFQCIVSSSYGPGDKIFNVHLKKTSVSITKTLPPDQIAAVGTTLLAVLILTIVVVVLFYPRIKLFILSRLPLCHLADIENKEYHALILHEEGIRDLEFVREIQRRLVSDGYEIAVLEDDILGGQGRLEMIQTVAYRCKSLIIIYPLEECTPEFTRIIGAQEYFQPNLITVVKKITTDQRTVPSLDDVALVRLIYPAENLNCSIYKQTNFYCKLKLRMPRRTRKRARPETVENGRRPEAVNLVNNEQRPNNSPFDHERFDFEGNNYPV